MNLFALNVVLALIWAAITNAFTPLNVLAGFAVGSIALWLLRTEFHTKYFLRGHRVARLALLFLYELVLSALRVARDVLRPGLNFQPGIIAYPLTTEDDVQITLLANLITLTPGTLSVDVSSDKTTLYIHAMHAHDPEGLKRDIRDGFERQIKETLG
jgi:multicomponent Na+:H+ antiporter subunit E